MGTKLYICNLPFSTTENELQELFSQAGAVQEVTLMQDRFTGKSRGFAFVTMGSEQDAQNAISKLNGQTVEGQRSPSARGTAARWRRARVWRRRLWRGRGLRPPRRWPAKRPLKFGGADRHRIGQGWIRTSEGVKPADLQSAPFGHFGTYPSVRALI